METAARTPAVIDTSALINFLRIDQVRLLSVHPAYSFFVTDHVRGAAFQAGHLTETAVDTVEEFRTFAKLTALKRFGLGECAAIAAAFCRNWAIAMDDSNATKLVNRLFPGVRIETTPSIMVALIRVRVLTVAQADGFRNEWATYHRFRLPFTSFIEVL